MGNLNTQVFTCNCGDVGGAARTEAEMRALPRAHARTDAEPRAGRSPAWLRITCSVFTVSEGFT